MRLGRGSSHVIPIDISFNDPICSSELFQLQSGVSILVANREDIVAEKLRALLQQPIRNRLHRQDVLDLAVLIRNTDLDRLNVAAYLQIKAEARDVDVSKTVFRHEEIRIRASYDYASLQALTRNHFIPFDEAFVIVLAFVDELEIPD
jgi:predicted nucleotidyltransferase component of viral defense system